MRHALFILLAPALIAAPAIAQERSTPRPPPAAQEPQAPSSSPSDADIQKLIVQLGSSDFDLREQAAKRLRQIGKPALPHLKAALTSPDAEIANRARILVARIETRPVPGPNPDRRASERSIVRLSIIDGNKVTDISENGRDIKIVEGQDGITMTVSGFVDGKHTTEQFAAASADELRNENAEAFKLYEQWTGGMGFPGGAMINPRLQIRGGGGLVIGPPQAAQELDLLRVRLEKQMKDNKTADVAREDVLAALEKLETARDFGGAMDEYLKAADDLHAVLEKQKLDPAELLPPPAKTRLGVSLSEVGGGLIISRVSENSRGERLGLKPGDVVRAVDGKEVANVAQLRKAVAAKEKELVLQVQRDGEELKLEEKDEK